MSHDHDHHHDPHDMLEDPEAGSTWFITISSILILFVVVLAVTAVFYTSQTEEVDEVVLDAPLQPLLDLRRAQSALIDGAPRWIDQEQKIVAIPITDAMDLVVKEYGR
ncbi:MAG: hypothetical protein KDA25_06360 [Phycisphaerales bacterium]|nr:hypothetical protein [Phycisphaerales bacterium]